MTPINVKRFEKLLEDAYYDLNEVKHLITEFKQGFSLVLDTRGQQIEQTHRGTFHSS